MKIHFPSISTANASTNSQSKEIPQTEEAPQRENATQTESTLQSETPISSQGTEGSYNLAYRVANANTRLAGGTNVIISDIEDLDSNIQDVATREYQ